MAGTRWADLDLGDLINLKYPNHQLLGVARVVGLNLLPMHMAVLMGPTDWHQVDNVLDCDPNWSLDKLKLAAARRLVNFYGRQRLTDTTLCTVIFLAMEVIYADAST